ERRRANTLATSEIGPELIPLFVARARRANAAGDVLGAARLFAPVARCDPHVLPPDKLRFNLAALVTDAQASGRLDDVIAIYLAGLRGGILLPVPITASDDLRVRLERLQAKDKDPAIRVYLADLLAHVGTRGTSDSRAAFARAQELLGDVHDDTMLPLA